MRQILIIIPTYNEVNNIKPLYDAINHVFSKDNHYIYDILFVDDNSPDGTSNEIKKITSKSDNVHLLNGEKEGLGKAYIRGIKFGLSLKDFYAVIMMDADLSHNPEDIPRLLQQIDQGYDYIIGSRYVKDGASEHGYSLYRRVISHWANIIARNFIGVDTNVRDLTSGFKAIRASKLKTISLQNLVASGYVFQVSLLYEFSKRKYKIKEVPITFRKRRNGRSKFRLKEMVDFLRVTYKMNT